jgi:hypothetical protein
MKFFSSLFLLFLFFELVVGNNNECRRCRCLGLKGYRRNIKCKCPLDITPNMGHGIFYSRFRNENVQQYFTCKNEI